MNLRAEMPLTAAWVDALREAFGREPIDGQIRAATRCGLQTFHACENGHDVGAPLPPVRVAISAADMVLIVPKGEPKK